MSSADIAEVVEESVEEALVWRRVRAGEADAFAAVYERHADAIYRYLFRRLADWADAEDLTAVVFLEAYRRRADPLLVDGRVLPWLYGIATNVLRNRWRTVRRHRRALARLAPARPTPDFAPDAAARLAATEEVALLVAKASGLPAAQQEAKSAEMTIRPRRDDPLSKFPRKLLEQPRCSPRSPGRVAECTLKTNNFLTDPS